jgi:hypothetical protein
MSGGSWPSQQEGVCARAIDLVLRTLPPDRELKMSVLEMHMDTITDLLAPLQEETGGAARALRVVQRPEGVSVEGLVLLPVTTEAEALDALVRAETLRAVSGHKLNDASSRSHMIVSLYLFQKSLLDVAQAKLHLVDLAGSERIHKTGSEGTLQREAAYINKSLSFLEQVVVALADPSREHIPYRQSSLTHLLKDSLGGSCITSMIACLWPHQDHLWECMSTLRFATRMMNLTNEPRRVSEMSTLPTAPVRHLLKQIHSLRRELTLRDMIAGRVDNSGHWLEALTREQRVIVQHEARSAALVPPSKDAESKLDDWPVLRSGAQIRELLLVLRKALWHACKHDADSVARAVDDALRDAESFSTEAPYSAPSVEAEAEADPVTGSQNALTMEHLASIEAPRLDIQSEAVLLRGTHASYTQAKAEEKVWRNKVKQLAVDMNSTKDEIDSATMELQEVPSEDTVLHEHIATQIKESKRRYRTLHAQLEQAKAEFAQAQANKEMHMAALVATNESSRGTSRDEFL